MRGARAVTGLTAAGTVVGIVFAIHGTITNSATSFRTGAVVVIIGLAGLLDARARHRADEATAAVVAHQASAARLTAQQKQWYAELGWKAAKIDSVNREDALKGNADGAQVFDLPAARASQEIRRDGSA